MDQEEKLLREVSDSLDRADRKVRIENILEEFLLEVYPAFKEKGFTLSEAYVAATLHDMEQAILRLEKLVEQALYED